MGRQYVFMLILEFFDLNEFFYISGRITNYPLTTLRIRGCPPVFPSVAKHNELQLKKLQVYYRDLNTFELSRMWRKKL